MRRQFRNDRPNGGIDSPVIGAEHGCVGIGRGIRIGRGIGIGIGGGLGLGGPELLDRRLRDDEAPQARG